MTAEPHGSLAFDVRLRYWPAMKSRSSLFGLLGIALSLFAAACSSSGDDNKVPVIDNIEGPATASVGPSGKYELSVTITAHDDDGTIAQVGVEIPGFLSQPPNNLPTPAAAFKAPMVLQLDAQAPKGALTYTIVVVDNDGAKASKSAQVTLQ